jgi:hypothetical protein
MKCGYGPELYVIRQLFGRRYSGLRLGKYRKISSLRTTETGNVYHRCDYTNLIVTVPLERNLNIRKKDPTAALQRNEVPIREQATITVAAT